MTFLTKVGSFTAKTSTGTQVIDDIGFQPKVLITFATPQTAAGWSANAAQGIGFAVSSSSYYYMADGAQNGLTTTNEHRRMGTAALGLVDSSGTVLKEATLTSFDSGGFTLNYTTADANGYIINYMALGGTELTNASIIGPWLTGTSTGNKSLTGAGFKPDLVIHMGAGTTALDANVANTNMVLGAMDSAGNVFFTHTTGADAVTTAATHRIQGAWGPLYQQFATTPYYAATFVSMDDDGFTLNFTTATNSRYIISLCLKGTSANSFGVGTVEKTTASEPTTQVVTPPNSTDVTGVLYAFNNRIAGTTIYGGSAFTIGASDGTSNRSNNWQNKTAVTTSVTSKRVHESAIVVANNWTSTDDAVFTTTSMGTNAFTMSLSTNNAEANVINYICFSQAAADVTVEGVTATVSPTANVPTVSVSLPGVLATASPVAAVSNIGVSVPGVLAEALMAANVGDIGGDISIDGVTANALMTANVGDLKIDVLLGGVTANAQMTANVPGIAVSLMGILATAVPVANVPSINVSVLGVGVAAKMAANLSSIDVSILGVMAVASPVANVPTVSVSLPGVTADALMTAFPSSFIPATVINLMVRYQTKINFSQRYTETIENDEEYRETIILDEEW